MHVYVCTYTHVCTHKHAHIQMLALFYKHMHTNTHTLSLSHTHTHTHTDTLKQICTHALSYTNIHVKHAHRHAGPQKWTHSVGQHDGRAVYRHKIKQTVDTLTLLASMVGEVRGVLLCADIKWIMDTDSPCWPA